MPAPSQLEIFIDAACPFCQWVRARIERFDTAHRLRFLDYSDPLVAAQPPFSREELDQEMHVRLADGTWHAGFAGWVVVLRALPRLAWLGWLLSSQLFRRIGPRLYHWVAKNRYRFPGLLPRCRADICERARSRPQG
jgi:predicted DCC family thiol-disulfide oxidoreductase YuxK